MFNKTPQGVFRHPDEMGATEIRAFLTHLAVEQNIAASTQNQALSALLFLYREVLGVELEPVDVVWAQKPKRLPTVLTREQVRAAITALSGDNQLVARLLYGSGLRLLEALRLRVKDLDFDYCRANAFGKSFPTCREKAISQ